MFRPERTGLGALALLAVLAAGCGKSNLAQHTGASPTAVAPAHTNPPAQPRPAAPALVAIPLKLTAARAAAFAQAVNLQAVDVPGAHRAPRTSTEEDRQEESEQCSHDEAQAIGGGRSERLDRGSEVEAESISSSVIVMRSPAVAEKDLAYTESPAGLRCYTKLLREKLARESTASVAIGRVVVQRLKLVGASGIRISARISGAKSGVALSLYIDAVAFQYGPAEVELYGTSFVQPVARRTEQELVNLMRARALLNPL